MLLLQPGLLLIDFGHFQYNSVMLGTLVHLRSLIASSLPQLMARAHSDLSVLLRLRA